MQTYGDLINRIVEIIELSNKKKSEMIAQEVKDYNDHFVKMLWCDIDITLANEFQDLLDFERTFMVLNNSEKPEAKNLELLQVCQEQGSIDNQHTEDYLHIMELLNNADQANVEDLREYKGYFLLKDDLAVFISLCRKLGVGPYTLLKDMDREEAKAAVNREMALKNEQYQRIKASVQKAGYVVENNGSIPVIEPSTYEEVDDALEQNSIDEIIYLGIVGKLTSDMVVDMKKVMPDDSFNKLLKELKIWKIFSEKKIKEIKERAYSHSEYIRSIDELIGFLALREDLNPDALKAFIPSIGVENYHYMIDQLFKFGIISFEYYMENLRELMENGLKK